MVQDAATPERRATKENKEIKKENEKANQT
jgi:hypothetical protein